MEQQLKKLSELIISMTETLNYILSNDLDGNIILDEFKKQKQRHYFSVLNNSFNELGNVNTDIKKKMEGFHNIIRVQELLNTIISKSYSKKELLAAVSELKQTLPQETKISLNYELKNIPSAIKSEVMADLEEAKRSYENNCYRSSTILCGRILETCLHRKYFEITKNDLLETCPGLGLGKMIARLKELKIDFDPGLTEQIHLINKIRIGSVHIKKQPFIPTKSQTQAMLLYTVDVINKLF